MNTIAKMRPSRMAQPPLRPDFFDVACGLPPCTLGRSGCFGLMMFSPGARAAVRLLEKSGMVGCPFFFMAETSFLRHFYLATQIRARQGRNLAANSQIACKRPEKTQR